MLKCPLCNKNSEFKSVFFKDRVFASGDVFEFKPLKYLGDRDYGKGNCIMDLKQCCKCGYIYNFAFDKDKMMQVYSSDTYYQQKNFTLRLNENLLNIKEKIKTHADQNSVFLEIAPGLCDLLLILAKESKFIYSVDPSPMSFIADQLDNITHIQDFFNVKSLKSQIKHKIDFIIFRHLLEHIETPRKFLEEVVEFLEIGGKIYIEVPNTLEIFEHKKFYELFHDHVGFFQKNILINIMSHLGCKIIDSHFIYEEQWMGLFFEKISEKRIQNLPFKIFNDEKYFVESIERLNNYLLNYENIALMGGGIHSNTMIEFIEERNLKNIKVCFDANPEKQGRYLQNSEIEIVLMNKANLENIDCILMCVPLHEDNVFKNEILEYIKNGLMSNLKAVVLTAKEIKLIKFKDEDD
ncbi:class I SAM-dependent methyltransferase [Campylobacter jejuni]|nr:class I SAM-dependent methyltransferase [Campylobacter jejuni]